MEQGELVDGTLSNIVYRADLTNATDITNVTYDGKELEYTADPDALSGTLTYMTKTQAVNLREMGWTAEKAEGLCMLPNGKTLALIIKDDFGLSGASVNPNARKSPRRTQQKSGWYRWTANPDISLCRTPPKTISYAKQKNRAEILPPCFCFIHPTVVFSFYHILPV